jgi:putative transposase
MKDLEKENARLRRAISDLTLDKLILQEAATGKLLSPARRRRCIDQVREVLDVSERRVCRVLGQHRSTQRKVPCGADDEQALTDDVVALAKAVRALRLPPGDRAAACGGLVGEPQAGRADLAA